MDSSEDNNSEMNRSKLKLIIRPVQKPGQIRIGKIIYQRGKPTYPSYPNFTPIVVMTKSSKYGSLGPYVLKNGDGQIMENIWQFSKVYPSVSKSRQTYSRYQNFVIWDHPAEVHTDNHGNPLDIYWEWRNKGFNAEYPIRYPVGRKLTSTCLYALKDRNGQRLDYIQARKGIYLTLYTNLVKSRPQYSEIYKRWQSGENLLITEIDGPHQESMDYYQSQYNVDSDFIQESTILGTYHNLKILLNDPRHPFGHGYCLAAVLQGFSQNLVQDN